MKLDASLLNGLKGITDVVNIATFMKVADLSAMEDLDLSNVDPSEIEELLDGWIWAHGMNDIRGDKKKQKFMSQLTRDYKLNYINGEDVYQMDVYRNYMFQPEFMVDAIHGKSVPLDVATPESWVAGEEGASRALWVSARGGATRYTRYKYIPIGAVLHRKGVNPGTLVWNFSADNVPDAWGYLTSGYRNEILLEQQCVECSIQDLRYVTINDSEYFDQIYSAFETAGFRVDMGTVNPEEQEPGFETSNLVYFTIQGNTAKADWHDRPSIGGS